MANRRSSFGSGGRKTSLDSARGISLGNLGVLSTTKVFAGILILMGIIATSATLLIGQEASSNEVTDFEHFDASDGSTSTIPEETTSSTIATTTSTSTTEATTTSTTSTTMKRVRVEKTTTTTTLACGGDWQLPCEEGCNEEALLGSDVLCHIPDCVKSVPSGKAGCGAFALRFCSGGTYVRSNLDREVIGG